jgi:hypothetical protein
MQVDAAVAGSIMGLPWGRFETLLAAKIIQPDPRAAEDQAKIWEAERFVRAGRSRQSGLKLLIAKANAGDVIWFLATINRIAEILRLKARRSKAIGILAQPALAFAAAVDVPNPNNTPAADGSQASGSGNHHTRTTTSSPTPEPKTSATNPSHAAFGRRQHPRANASSKLDSPPICLSP